MTLLACEMSASMVACTFSGTALSLGLEGKLVFSSPVAISGLSEFADILNAAL